jgi:dihydropteroate synthase
MNNCLKQLQFSGALVNFDTPIVMGILNSTPDSFYSKSRNVSEVEILRSAEKILQEGAKIIDIGGYSTRPNAAFVSAEEETRRVAVAIELIQREFPDAVLSVDTFRATVANFVCKNYNVPIINDVGGGMWDKQMFETIKNLQVTYILMHTSPTPETMMLTDDSINIVSEVIRFFNLKITQLNRLGINDIILDLGFGFAKTVQQNYALLHKMHYFQHFFDLPILAGVSRKSMIQRVLGITSEDALNGTTAVNMLALANGAHILRVHDVREAVEAVKIFEQTKG